MPFSCKTVGHGFRKLLTFQNILYHLLFLDQMHNPQSYVRDFYFFKRTQHPQLVMVRMDPNEAHVSLQQQAFTYKLIEIGKVLMAWAIMRQDQVRAEGC